MSLYRFLCYPFCSSVLVVKLSSPHFPNLFRACSKWQILVFPGWGGGKAESFFVLERAGDNFEFSARRAQLWGRHPACFISPGRKGPA